MVDLQAFLLDLVPFELWLGPVVGLLAVMLATAGLLLA